MVKLELTYTIENGVSASVSFDSKTNELLISHPSSDSEFKPIARAFRVFNPNDLEMTILGGFGAMVDKIRDETERPKLMGNSNGMAWGESPMVSEKRINTTIAPPRSPLVRPDLESEFGEDEIDMEEDSIEESAEESIAPWAREEVHQRTAPWNGGHNTGGQVMRA